MKSFVPLALVLVLSVSSVACTVKSSDDEKAGPPPEASALFAADLPAPTADVLRGTWALPTETTSQGTADLRIGITDGKIVVAAHCVLTYEGKSYDLTAGQSSPIDSADIDGKSGSFTSTTSLSFQATDGPARCTGRFDAATWEFAVTGTKAKIGPTGGAAATWTKVGD